MQRTLVQSLTVSLALAAALLTGCGSSSSKGSGGAGGGGGVRGFPINFAAPPGTTESTTAATGTALFHVDVASGQVKVSPLAEGASSRAALQGSAAGFTTTTLFSLPGNTGVRALSVRLKNQSNVTLGQRPSGGTAGLRVLFGSLNATTPDLTPAAYTTVTTLAGTGTASSLDGSVGSATFNEPTGACYGAHGEIYVAEGLGGRIRRIADGQVTTLAGHIAPTGADGSATTATFVMPYGIAYNSPDSTVVVCDFEDHKIRRVTADGQVTTIAGTGTAGGVNGSGNVATFNAPIGVAIANSGNTLYVAEYSGHRVRQIDYVGPNPRLASSWTVSTLAGTGSAGSTDGVGVGASFNCPTGICTWHNVLYVLEGTGRRLRRVGLDGAVTVVAGTGAPGSQDGSGEQATFVQPFGLAAVPAGLVVADPSANRLRLLTPKNGGSGLNAASWWVRALAGTGVAGSGNGVGTAATFNRPNLLGADAAGNVAVPEVGSNLVRRVAVPSVIGEPGTPTGGASSDPIVLTNADGYYRHGTTVLPYRTINQSLLAGASSGSQEWWFKVPSGVNAFEFTVTVEAPTTGLLPLQAGTASLGSADNWVRTLAGQDSSRIGYADGPPAQAQFYGAYTTGVDGNGVVYVADFTNRCVRRVAPDGTVSTICGSPGVPGDGVGTGEAALLSGPTSVVPSADGQRVFIADEGNAKIKLATLSGDATKAGNWTVTTIAGGGATTPTTTELAGLQSKLNRPWGLALDPSGALFMTDLMDNAIYRLRPYNGGTTSYLCSLVAGTPGSHGSTNGTLTASLFYAPDWIARAPNGDLYVDELSNAKIRRISPSGNQVSDVWTVSPQSARGVAVDPAGSLFVLLDNGPYVARIDNGMASVVVGVVGIFGSIDGPGDVARLGTGIRGLTCDASGTLYWGESSRIRMAERMLVAN